MSERVIRFGLGNDAGLRSGTWRCWWNGANNFSFCFGSRHLDGADFYLSFHPSGECNFSMTEEPYRRLAENGRAPPGRYIEWWRRPDLMAPGVTHVCNVVLPGGSASEPIRERERRTAVCASSRNSSWLTHHFGAQIFLRFPESRCIPPTTKSGTSAPF